MCGFLRLPLPHHPSETLGRLAREFAATYSDIGRWGGATFFQCIQTKVGFWEHDYKLYRLEYDHHLHLKSQTFIYPKLIAQLYFPIRLYDRVGCMIIIIASQTYLVQLPSYHVILHLEITCFNLRVSFGATFVETPSTTHPSSPPSPGWSLTERKKPLTRQFLGRAGAFASKGVGVLPFTSFEQSFFFRNRKE